MSNLYKETTHHVKSVQREFRAVCKKIFINKKLEAASLRGF